MRPEKSYLFLRLNYIWTSECRINSPLRQSIRLGYYLLAARSFGTLDARAFYLVGALRGSLLFEIRDVALKPLNLVVVRRKCRPQIGELTAEIG
jgi:hypothetical protein